MDIRPPGRGKASYAGLLPAKTTQWSNAAEKGRASGSLGISPRPAPPLSPPSHLRPWESRGVDGRAPPEGGAEYPRASSAAPMAALRDHPPLHGPCVQWESDAPHGPCVRPLGPLPSRGTRGSSPSKQDFPSSRSGTPDGEGGVQRPPRSHNTPGHP